MSNLKKTFPRILKTGLIIGVGVYIPMSMFFSLVNVGKTGKKSLPLKAPIEVAHPVIQVTDIKVSK